MQIEYDEAKERQEILSKYRSLLRASKDRLNAEEKKCVRKAFDLAMDAHAGVRRKSGELYIFHPIAVAHIVAKEMGLGYRSIACALIHDVVEDSDYTLEDIERMFGEKVARIIDGLTKISGVFDQNISQQAENFRKMLLTLSDDVRVILIKLADRLHNMRTMDSMPPHKQEKIASETLYLYAPLAHRLGLYTIKSELEDLGLKYTQRQVYHDISEKLAESKRSRNRYISKFVKPISSTLEDSNIKCEIIGRPKSIFSIWKKMQRQGVSFDEVYDKFAIRIIIDSELENEKADCWKAYSIVTDFYKPNPDRLRDWISTPKSNGYESLHTTVMGPNGYWVEVQIRTRRMDEVAEKGYAAHWRYKTYNPDQQKGASLDTWIERIRELLENPAANAIDFVDDVKLSLYADEIYVFTPKGELRTLPKGATALDFAFEIHTEVGKHCLGCKVNGKLVPLSHELDSGDQVEVLTSEKQRPKEDWLNFVVTGKAKGKIKSSLKEERKKIADLGKEILERKLRHLKVNFNKKTLEELQAFFKLKNESEVLYRVGSGIIDNKRLKEFVAARSQSWYNIFKKRFNKKDAEAAGFNQKPEGKPEVLVFGPNEETLEYSFAKCCNPIQGDNVFGFLTINSGIKVHKSTCPNAIRLRSNYAYRILKAKWVSSQRTDFTAHITIKGLDRVGLVNDLTRTISNAMNVNIKAINIKSNDGIFEGKVSLVIYDNRHLNDLIEKVKAVDGITEVIRK